MRKILLFISLSASLISVTAQNLNYQYLDKNRVKAQISKTNDRFWDNFGTNSARYEVPKGSHKNAQFVNSIWIGGLDKDNLLHLCANTYKQNGTDYWPGPLNTSDPATFDATVAARYDRVWKVDCDDINAFVTAYNSGSVYANSSYTIPEAIANYPALENGNYMGNMESYNDANNNGHYNPAAEGDYPVIKGHQQILSIYNDMESTHGESGALAMGLEIHEKSYAFYEPNAVDSMKAINFTTFYEYTIYNRSPNSYHDVYITDFADVDLGYFLDDYVGTDTANQFVYSYNGHNNDPSALGVTGYANKPPVISHAMLSDCPACLTDGVDNNNDGDVDESGEKFTISHVTYFNNDVINTPAQTTRPLYQYEYYNYMTGRWRDSTFFEYGGTAHSSGAAPTGGVFTGDPQTNTGWTESTAGNAPGDRRFLMSSGPFNFPARRSVTFSYAIVFSQDTTANVNTITEFDTRVKNDISHIRYYEQTHRTPECRPAIALGLKDYTENLNAMVYPNPSNDRLTIALDKNSPGAKITLRDLTGRSVKSATIQDGYKAQINISDLENGIYMLEVIFNNARYVEKVIKN